MESGILKTITRMNAKAATALARLDPDAAADAPAEISALDAQITGTYEREKHLQAMIDQLSDEIEALTFLGGKD